MEACGEIVILRGFRPVCEARLVAVRRVLRPDQPQVAHRELREAVLDPAEIEEQQVTGGIEPILHQQALGLEVPHEVVRVDVGPSEFDELGLFQ